ncbi:helix-turn-helix domain-containing protein [Nonomuraea phyllanthi]|uniref:Helix-turn-helix domain-containing protein n=2 Tax=Nonomuraea phyllanthi TaxID=2219224 RepID=A0A5C4WXP0_9ACTN|nr:helix-turn-helix domain-containing protein [Nonomuraea phyllanthi]QFY14119.1 helix-turn-helix domain-containing protein [Nonomuraea phyllanthi]
MRAAVRKRLAQGVRVDPATSAIARELRHGRTVGEVAWDLGFSERQLHRRSVSSFGYAPKTLQRIVRFQHALRLARAGVPLAEVAVTSGYADQAHLSHDVKRLSGVSMRDLVSLASG